MGKKEEDEQVTELRKQDDEDGPEQLLFFADDAMSCLMYGLINGKDAVTLRIWKYPEIIAMPMSLACLR